MIRTLSVLAAEGSPAGDMIRENDTLVGAGCVVLVVVVILVLVNRGKK